MGVTVRGGGYVCACYRFCLSGAAGWQFAFNSCEDLTSVTIPDSVTLIGEVSFNVSLEPPPRVHGLVNFKQMCCVLPLLHLAHVAHDTVRMCPNGRGGGYVRAC